VKKRQSLVPAGEPPTFQPGKSRYTDYTISTPVVVVVVVIIIIMTIRQKNTYSILLRNAQHLHHLNTLTDTIRWLLAPTGRYLNMWGYRVLTGTTNTYLKGSSMSTVPLLCGTYRLSQIEQYYQTDLMQYCMIKGEDLPTERHSLTR
jgi:hypothetical protein